jgi:hypothetical protein
MVRTRRSAGWTDRLGKGRGATAYFGFLLLFLNDVQGSHHTPRLAHSAPLRWRSLCFGKGRAERLTWSSLFTFLWST